MSFPSIPDRYSTGLPELDRMLGGGLIPGTVCVVLGATGIGKSQLGIQFAATGEKQEGERGIFFDLTSRGDSQNHDDYAERLVNWKLTEFSPDQPWQIEDLWDPKRNRVDIAHLFARSGKRVTRQDLDENDYREWHADLTRKLDKTIRFFYGNFIHGVRRCVIDGVEPADSPSDSFQFDLFEYIHNQILRKEADWVARDLLRVHYRAHAEKVAEHSYPATQTSAMALCTSHEVMLDDLLARPLNSGDILSNANTIILMGKFRDGMKMGRALSIAKHRGSYCDETIIPYEISPEGLQLKI